MIAPGSFGLGDGTGGKGKKYGVKNTTKFKSLFGNSMNYTPIKPQKITLIKPSNTKQKSISFFVNQKLNKKDSFKQLIKKTPYPIFNRPQTFSINKSFMNIPKQVKQKQGLFNFPKTKTISKQNSFLGNIKKNNSVLLSKTNNFIPTKKYKLI
jgi:hypothetical protein